MQFLMYCLPYINYSQKEQHCAQAEAKVLTCLRYKGQNLNPVATRPMTSQLYLWVHMLTESTATEGMAESLEVSASQATRRLSAKLLHCFPEEQNKLRMDSPHEG